MALSEKDKQLTKKFIKRIPLFRNFSEDHINQIVEDFRIITVQKSHDIVFRADEGTDLFLVLKGRVKVSLLGPEGDEFVLTSFKPGDFFGEMSLIDGKPRSANVTAIEETSLSALKREVFIRTMKHNPSIAFDLLTAMVDRLRNATEIIETLAFLDVNERLVKFLVQSAKNDGDTDEAGFYRIRKYTHQELAAHIGSSREAVSKAMKVLAYKNSITEKEGHFLINPEACDDMDNIEC